MLDKIYIVQHCAALKLKAAQKYDIAPEKCHMGHLLLQAMLQRPKALCQIDAATGESETNLSVAIRTMRLASAMSKAGLQVGDVVVIMGVNHLDVCIPFYACHYNGLTICNMDPGIQPNEIQALFSNLKPKLVFCQKDCVELVKNAYTANKLQGNVVAFYDEDNNMETYIEQHNGTEVNFRPAEFDHSKINAWLIMTSGTTGLPKVAMYPYETVLNAICCRWQPYTQVYDKAFTMSNLQWISGYVLFASGPLRCYTRLQCSTPLTPPTLIGIINKYRPNATAWTPYIVNKFLPAVEQGLCDISCFDVIMIGGGRLEKRLLDRLKKQTRAWIYLSYGMTELMVSIFTFDDSVPENAVGYPVDKYQHRLIDDDGNDVTKPFKSGELWVKGDDFFKGYLNNPEETAKMITPDGWIKTGDIFYKDDQDFYYFVERKRLLIRNYAAWITPLALEEVIKQHPAVSEAAVIDIPDPDRMELAVGAIQTNGQIIDPEDIFALLRKSLPEHQQLTGGLFFIDGFPLTPSGKINRTKLREIAINAKRIMPK